MTSRWNRVALLLLPIAVWGCGVSRPAVELTGGYASPATAYGKLLPRFTREAQLYDGLDTVAKGFATWRALELRRAASEASVQRFHLSGAAAERLRDEQLQAARTVREFHLALYTPLRQLNDLESAGTLWRAFLELPDGARLEPLEVKFVRKTDKSSIEYPYVSPWTREYLLRFPLLEAEEPHEHLALVLAGVLGELRFEF